MSQQRIIWVTGKGGVGKSLMAAAVAHHWAQKGQRVLLAELGETSYFRDFIPELRSTTAKLYEPVATRWGFDTALWSGESCLREYVLHYVRVERIYRLFFENRVMSALINVAPGLREVAIAGKVTSGLRKVGPPLPYDVVVVDVFATGHALALWRAARGLRAAIPMGPMGHHSREIDAILRDKDKSKYIIVTIPEELPVQETVELRRALGEEFEQAPSLVLNRSWINTVSEDELSMASQEQPALAEFGKLVAQKLRQRKWARDHLGPLIEVPQFWTREPGELIEMASRAYSGGAAI